MKLGARVSLFCVTLAAHMYVCMLYRGEVFWCPPCVILILILVLLNLLRGNPHYHSSASACTIKHKLHLNHCHAAWV